MYPKAPQSLVLAWENALSFRAYPTIERRNGGTEERGDRFQLNQFAISQAIDIKITSRESYEEIDSFLANNLDRVFLFEGILFKLSEYKWVWESVDIWSLSAQLDQVYRP
jgi:hypothetical protein